MTSVPRESDARDSWWSRLLCRMGVHDWRNMDGRCCRCGYVDPLWR